MFSNLKKSILWDLSTSGTQTQDLETQQMVVDGLPRGQTERFMLAMGSLVSELFSTIEKGFHASSPLDADFIASDVTSGMLPVLLRRYNIEVADLTVEREKIVRNILDEIFHAWRLKGTDAFLRWIIGKIFGWRMRNTITLASSVLRCSVNGCTLYDPALSWEEQFILYDETQLTPDDKTTTIVDVMGDPDYWIKRDLLNKMMLEWGYPREFQFVNHN